MASGSDERSDVATKSVAVQTAPVQGETPRKEPLGGALPVEEGESARLEPLESLVPAGLQHLISPAAQHARAANVPTAAHLRAKFPRSQLLQWLEQLYHMKREADVDADVYRRPPRDLGTCLLRTCALSETHAAHTRAHNTPTGDFVYDFYLVRHGSREAAELDLMDLFACMRRCSDSRCVALFFKFLNKHFDTAPFPANALCEGYPKPAQRSPDARSPKTSTRRDGLSPKTLDALSPKSDNNLDDHLDDSNYGGSGGLDLQESLRRDLIEHKAGLNGSTLTVRTLQFYLKFRDTVTKHGSGPFRQTKEGSSLRQNKERNGDAVWVELQSFADIVTLVLKCLSLTALQSVLKAVSATAISSKTLFEQSGMVQVLDGGQAKFVDLDNVIELVLDAYLREDARLHHAFYASLMTYDPTKDPNQANQPADKQGRKVMDPALREPTSLARLHAVLKLTQCGWDDNKTVRVYTAATQRMRTGPPTLDDIATLVRNHGPYYYYCPYYYCPYY